MEKDATKKPITKTAFVLGLPKTLAAKEVVERGKAVGISLTDKHVYSIRSAAKTSKRRTVRSAKAAPKKRGFARRAAGVAHHGKTTAADLLRAVAAELGLSNAIAKLEAEQQKVRAVLGR